MKKSELIQFRDKIANEYAIANKKRTSLKRLLEEVEHETSVRRNLLDSLNALIDMNENDE